MHSGDLATMDANGYVRITGRIKDMIIRGGENIYPREIEEFLLGHPAIADAQVFGVADEKYGEEVCAWVIAKPGTNFKSLADFKGKKVASLRFPSNTVTSPTFAMKKFGGFDTQGLRERCARRTSRRWCRVRVGR